MGFLEKTRSHNRGSVLLLGLWAVAALATLGIGQATRVSLGLKWAARTQEFHQAWYLGWAGVETAWNWLLSDTNLDWDAPSEPWGKPLPDPVRFGPGSFRLTIRDEQQKIPLNSAPVDLLKKLPGFTPEVAQKIVDLRNDPENPRTISHLAELSAFTDLGFLPEFLRDLDRVVTVTAMGPVNINTCSSEVLQRMGFSSGFSDQISALRPGADGIWGTADDLVFRKVDEIEPTLDKQGSPLLPDDKQTLNRWIGQPPPMLGVKSSFFRVEVVGKADRHGTQRRVVAILDRSNPGTIPQVRGWNES